MILDNEDILINEVKEVTNNPFELLKVLLYDVDDFRSKNEDIHKIIHYLDIPKLENHEIHCLVAYDEISLYGYDIYGYIKFRLARVCKINNKLNVNLLASHYLDNLEILRGTSRADYVKLKTYIEQLTKQYNFAKDPAGYIYYTLTL